jgi:hypothetical protein|mmetsp:Transcript_22129/g.39886  ORF Transcript_22129/g.39886 Transcript_22129/m.39886 type:complete len:170 (+) Transcript_22129:61-570(+)
MLHPINHIKEEWSNSSTLSGKIGVILFYTYVWLGVVSLTYLFIDPTSQGVSCAIDGFDDYTASVLNMTTRLYAPYLIVFFLYIEWHGARSLCNVAVLATVGTISLCGMAATPGIEDDEHRVSQTCSDYMKNSLIANVVWSWLVLLFVLINYFQTQRSGTAVDSQPLLTS